MAYPNPQGRPTDEMYLNKPQDRDSPGIEPLRMTRRSSAASPSNSISSQQNGRVPGASSKAAPTYPLPSLPNPDGYKPQPKSTNGVQVPYPYPDPKRVGSPDQGKIVPSDPTARARSGSSSSKNTVEYPR